ncbi:hypothetical protein TVAG_438400 [Trichomonas vaginalis G3]|uniref:Pumilio-family RNA binding repeat containing protein n=1 Tax=Trichomonas vaginalis (strain ATCC PRA-98 / G3) TaxID=412133 RepID=A2EYN6_TRIV3|nr:pumilio-like protein 3 family [Trichomonas vaginalis G3]EAY02249.1 hypothetical protein TVAG_438400 [Trichomonas vaginalis G3]KAI5507279.1 pumilio-like protein 3 family [Trichomonas vaginalis G3]|eukprot:XP_001330608.1 hypothetical protein [Trichomonas vaginalis G3]
MSYEENNQEKKQLDPKIVELRRLYEAAKPKSLSETQRKNNIRELFEYIKPDFEKLIRRPDGSRAAQLVFHRGDEEVRNEFLELLKPQLLNIIQSRYQYRIALAIIKDSTTQQRDQIFEALYGEYSILVKHRYGCIVVDALYEKINREQKNKMLFDICWDNKRGKVKLTIDKIKKYNFKSTTGGSDDAGPRGITFDQIVSISQQIAKDLNRGVIVEAKKYNLNTLDWTLKLLDFAGDKHLAQFKVIQSVILIVGEHDPSTLGSHLVRINDIAYSSDGSRVELLCIKNAKENELRGAIKLIEPHERKNLMNLNEQQAQNGEEEDQQNGEEEQQQNEEPEQQNDEGNDDQQQSEGEEEEEFFELNNTCKLAVDEYGWRVLSACISYIKDKSVVMEEVLPNLFDMWDWIKKNKYVQQLLYRILEKTNSVYCGIDFQGPEPINDELANTLVNDYLIPVLKDSLDALYENPQGSGIIVSMLERTHGTENFDLIADLVFTKENLTHKVAHKLVKLAIQKLGGDAVKRVREIIDQVGLKEILNTPGAWVVAELCERDEKLRKQAIKVIEENKIPKKQAINAIVNPIPQSEKQNIIMKNRKRSEKNDRAKRAAKK